MSARLHLTALEVKAILAMGDAMALHIAAGLAVAAKVDAPASLKDESASVAGTLEVYERGAAKLRRKLANMQRGRR